MHNFGTTVGGFAVFYFWFPFLVYCKIVDYNRQLKITLTTLSVFKDLSSFVCKNLLISQNILMPILEQFVNTILCNICV